MVKPRHLILLSNIQIDEYLARTIVCKEEAQVGVSLDETFFFTESYIDSVGFGLLLDH